MTVATPPETWSPAEAKEFLWAASRLPATTTIYRISLVEVEPELSWRIEVVTPGGTVTTPLLRLSSMALVSVFEPPWVQGACISGVRCGVFRSLGIPAGRRAGVPRNTFNYGTFTTLWERRSIC